MNKLKLVSSSDDEINKAYLIAIVPYKMAEIMIGFLEHLGVDHGFLLRHPFTRNPKIGENNLLIEIFHPNVEDGLQMYSEHIKRFWKHANKQKTVDLKSV